jgi:hypothetical protein
MVAVRSSSRSRSSPVSGAGIREAKMAARRAASDRRACQMWSVEMCPWWTDFSRADWAEVGLRGEGEFD